MLREFGARDGRNGVEVLRLRYLKHLHSDWDELRRLYSELRFVEAQHCLAAADHCWPLDEKGVWRKSNGGGEAAAAASQQPIRPGRVSPEIVGDESK
uniref:Uncharacterized protein n=1 Tax=Arundo donax TaxID=35708 RepID=A0A0A9EQH7_ARUDO